MIEITGSYLLDRAAAVEAKILAHDAHPRNLELLAIIQDYNSKQESAPEMVSFKTDEEKRAMVAQRNLDTRQGNLIVQQLYNTLGPKRASLAMAEYGRPMTPATVGQINATLKIIQSSEAIRALFEAGYVRWGYLYHLRHVVIEHLEADLLAKNGLKLVINRELAKV